jgi:hypothetical protein
MCNKEKYEVPSTIEDMDVVEELHKHIYQFHKNE